MDQVLTRSTKAELRDALLPVDLDSLLADCDRETSVFSRVLTRAFDICGASFLLVLTLPVIVLSALAIRVTSRGPAFYSSVRYGRNGKTFGALKLRSMVCEDEQQQLLSAHEGHREQLEHDFKLVDDPRVTPFGHFLRRRSLDELPQLINVLKGDMSLVGPRPKQLDEGLRYGETLAAVTTLRPGLTGLWQTSGRSDLPFEARIVLDLRYVASRTLRGDIKLCFTTARQLLSPRPYGAY